MDDEDRQKSFLDATREVFRPAADDELSDADLHEITQNLTGFFRLLGDWSRQAEQRQDPFDQREEPANGIENQSPKC